MFSNLLKLILGFLLAIAILVGSGVAVALYFMNRTAIPPARPIYSNDNPALKESNSQETKTEIQATPKSESQATTPPSQTPSPTETSEPLPKGAYKGRVTWSQGLSLRSEPTQEAQRIGGVGFNEKIIVLEENPDKNWVKIRTEGSKQEGWIKVGNIQRLEE